MFYSALPLHEVYEPLYKKVIYPYPWETELLHSKTLRRLKHLTHYGSAALVTPVTHSRYEHTLGVWTIISTFFPHEEELRIAALLHDVGHLPFSHAVEKTLGFNHHLLTEEKIRGEEVSGILSKHGFDSERIVDILNRNTPLAHQTPFLSADHLDSFLRDSFMRGKYSDHPADMLKRIDFNENYIETDISTGKQILEMIYEDHTCFLHPLALGMDALLAKAVSIYAHKKNSNIAVIQSMTNNELVHLLIHSGISEVEELMNIILWNPERIRVIDYEAGLKVSVRKVYDKDPLVGGQPLSTINKQAEQFLRKIRELKKDYYITF